MREGGLYKATTSLYYVAAPVFHSTYSFLPHDTPFLFLGVYFVLTNKAEDRNTGNWKTENWHFWKILLGEEPVWLLANDEEGFDFLLEHLVELTHNDLDASGKTLQNDSNVI